MKGDTVFGQRRPLAARGASGGNDQVSDANREPLLAQAHEAWAEDRHTQAIQLYVAVLKSAGAEGLSPGSMQPRDHLQSHANLGSSYMLLADEQSSAGGSAALERREALLAASLKHWRVADAAGPKSPMLDYFLTSVARDLHLASAGAAAARQSLDIEDKRLGDGPRFQPIDRRAASGLSYGEFLEEYVAPGIPVVITGLAPGAPQWDWDLSFWKEKCGSCMVPLKRLEPGAAGRDWAALGTAGPEGARIPLREHLQAVTSAGDSDATAPMLFDHALEVLCPDLLRDFVVPRYFAADYLRSIPSSERDDLEPAPGRFPSLFVQPSGSRCGLHVDQAGTYFYQMLIAGKKRWRVFPKEETPKLYPRRHGLIFEADTFSPDLGKFPLLGTARGREAVLEPGEAIFVPQNSAHQVQNEEASVAISANYVDGLGLEASLAELELLSQGGAEPGYVATAAALRRWAPGAGSKAPTDPGDLSWADFDRAAWM